jgi:hypothetical protein
MKKKLPLIERFLLFFDEYISDMSIDDAVTLFSIMVLLVFVFYSVFYVF